MYTRSKLLDILFSFVGALGSVAVIWSAYVGGLRVLLTGIVIFVLLVLASWIVRRPRGSEDDPKDD